jgi:hypothetical protein
MLDFAASISQTVLHKACRVSSGAGRLRIVAAVDSIQSPLLVLRRLVPGERRPLPQPPSSSTPSSARSSLSPSVVGRDLHDDPEVLICSSKLLLFPSCIRQICAAGVQSKARCANFWRNRGNPFEVITGGSVSSVAQRFQ